MTVVATETENLMLGTCIVGPWGRSPAVMAMTISTLSYICPGTHNTRTRYSGASLC